MKRIALLVSLGAIVLAGTVFVGAASAQASGIQVTLTPTSITVTGESTKCHAGVQVWLVESEGPLYSEVFAPGTFTAVVDGLTPNTDYEVKVWVDCNWDQQDPSFDQTYRTPLPTAAVSGGGENHVFLCYSAYQSQPGVWPASEAKTLFAEGYWLAYSVPGNVRGGTNVGDYHLVCNLAGTQSVSDTFVGDAGETLSSAYTGTFQIYPSLG